MATSKDAAADPFVALLGIEVLEVGAGRARLRGRVGPSHRSFHGTAHGGFLFTLADAAFAYASNSRDGAAVALTTSMQYFRPVRVGDEVEAQATEVHLGRSTAGYRIDLTVGGVLVAAFNGTVFRVPEVSPRARTGRAKARAVGPSGERAAPPERAGRRRETDRPRGGGQA